MNITISNTADKPIYCQICNQIKDCIVTGELHEGDMLPSLRALAKELKISVITTKRAYDELENEGYIHTVASKGCYVAPLNTQQIRESFLQEIENCFQKVIELSNSCNLTDEEAINIFKTMQKENKNERY